MGKRANWEKVEKFRKDLATLRERFTNAEIASELEVNPTNLSSYLSANKTPGAEIINRFYMRFAEQLHKEDYTSHVAEIESGRLVAESPEYRYARPNINEELIRMKKAESELWHSSIEKLIEANKELVSTNAQLVKATLLLIEKTQTSSNPKVQGAPRKKKLSRKR